ncbi:hypothetical protein CEXT_714051 [Caerostris extrusa]|uniref:Uncharacterized protein n=1 Tax=Caerostris extrusa TaxID=172846 RepID=A0AAV4N6D0_CAEEX|nr:hypothetical protein CEXT_714051 [Caerostris extrusa]
MEEKFPEHRWVRILLDGFQIDDVAGADVYSELFSHAALQRWIVGVGSMESNLFGGQFEIAVQCFCTVGTISSVIGLKIRYRRFCKVLAVSSVVGL